LLPHPIWQPLSCRMLPTLRLEHPHSHLPVPEPASALRSQPYSVKRPADFASPLRPVSGLALEQQRTQAHPSICSHPIV